LNGRAALRRLGIIDIGSNTIRLVVYSVEKRLPVPMFNEKATCRLSAGLTETGMLNPDGVAAAICNIERFVLLARAMEVESLALIATAAVRRASDGPDFVSVINARCDVKVEVLSGEEEAKLAAIGIVHGIPDADGLMCDLGGGSLDLVLLDKGRAREFGTLPLGHIVLNEASNGKAKKAQGIVRKTLEEIPWIDAAKGRTLYAVGGSLRALAKLYMDQSRYPIHIVDEFTIHSRVLRDLSGLVSHMSPESLRNSPSISSKRVDTFPMAALVVENLIQRTGAKEVVFCGSGMREGKVINMIPQRKKNFDPLIAACEVASAATGRFSLPGKELYQWISPLFDNDTDQHDRCRMAACLMSDICWNEHPDYRAEHAFERTLRLPVAGLDHAQRVFLALAIYVRYGGNVGDKITRPVTSLVDDDALQGAKITGAALRLGHVLAGSAPGLLRMARLEVKKDTVALISDHDPCLVRGEVVERRLKNLSQVMGIAYEIQT